MSEFIGLAYFAEIPGVIWDINRVGPSTGLPTRTQQGDVSLLYEASHGDTQHIVLFPGTIEECFEYGWRAFDYAEYYQTVVFGFGDLDLGMNRWICKGFEYPEKMNRGKVIHTKEELERIGNFGRYRNEISTYLRLGSYGDFSFANFSKDKVPLLGTAIF